ncbi:CfrBI family restriction endonuclease [Thermoflexibacter ruber]|uniref:CfrBI restriction endonuclease n=1 Tax=Thermoflexibacter ruber TaxID=1003 RepID=A0A1I2KAN8_9BACT|nr:CfrBI family restriction endonuclease [Thermoflexibacter ruber]SFF64172.1 CfrBI restriction endonuclease [Thermoflexibacter ruber]
MTLTEQVTKNIISRLIKGQDYRIEVVALINAQFLQFAMDFFEKIVQAKLRNKDVIDWYKKEFLNPKLSSEEIAINSGLNKKTITNMFNSATKEIVIDASNEHYEILYNSILQLIENQSEIDLTLTIKFRGVSVELNINESLIVINTLAVKRAALRGGLWSTAGKKVEKPLMQTLCMLFDVPKENYAIHLKGAKAKQEDELDFEREIDFYLISNGQNHKCEVKLMGKGNPESADAVIARDSKVFIADKLSDLNKTQLDSLKVNWIELRSENGYQRFEKALQSLGISYNKFSGDIDNKLTEIFALIF